MVMHTKKILGLKMERMKVEIGEPELRPCPLAPPPPL
jgi:hypothetical protein